MAVATTTVGALVIAIVIGALSFLFRAKVDPREPPVIHSTIPLVGHIIGMLREGPLYIARVSAKTNVPIFTLPTLGNSTYVCQSPQVAALIQRASSTLDFDGIVTRMTPRMIGSDERTKRILLDDTAKEEGRVPIVTKAHDIINPPLSMQNMGLITDTQLGHFSDFINRIGDGQEVGLYHFITREVTAATMHSFYGPRNPFAVHPELIDAFWDYEEEMVAYMTGVLPSVFAPKAKRGLERCVKGFEEYAKADGYKDAYILVQNRKRLHEEGGISPHEHARLEFALCFGLNANASITTFWVLNNIFSRPELLDELRQEIANNAIVAPGTISFAKLKDACPLLNSAYKESMRIIAPMTSARLVLEDTLIADTYLLRKGAVVQIAGGILHNDASIWGPDVSSFNPRRFQHSWSGSKTDASGNVSASKTDHVHAQAFRGFGGGASLCPGRHVAQMEIVSLSAAILYAFDIVAPRGESEIAWDPPRDEKRFPISVMKPLRDVRVRFRRRAAMEDLTWTLQA